MTRRVCFSADANPIYQFYLPLTALMWREVAGYHALVELVGTAPGFLLDRLREIIRSGDIVCVEPPQCCGTPASAQLVRLLSYLAQNIADDDYLMTCDADIWPLQAAVFEPHNDAPLLIYPSSCLLNNPGINTPAFPICYIGARTSLWRSLMGIEANSLREGLELLFLTEPLLSAGGFNADEAVITKRIMGARNYPEGFHCVPRDGFPPRGRIDRAAWPENVRLHINGARNMFIDAHLPRPGYADENWSRIRPLLELYLSPKWLRWCDDYRAEYLGRMIP